MTLNADGSFVYTPTTGYVGNVTFSYEAVDSSGASSAPAMVTLSVLPTPPTAVGGSYSLTENTTLTANAAQGVLANASDPNGETLSANLVSGPSDGSLTLNTDGSFFYTPDAGFAGWDSFTYTAVDTSGLSSAPTTVTLSVAGPISVGLSSFTVPEGQPALTVVGTFSAFDPDPNATFTYSLVSCPCDIAGHFLFSISQTDESWQLRTAQPLAYQSQPFEIQVMATDQATGLSCTKSLQIVVTPTQAPTGLSLSSVIIPSGRPANSVIGTFSTADPDTGDTFTYNLVSGWGDTYNADFTVSGNQLLTGEPLAVGGYSILVQTIDENGLSFQESFTITVTAATAATDVVLSSSSVAANQSAGTVVGSLWTADTDPTDSFTYSLVSSPCDPDGNPYFSINGNQLLAAEVIPNAGTYSVQVQVTDASGLSFTKSLSVTVAPAGQPPVVILNDSSLTLMEGSIFTSTGSFSDSDSTQTEWTATVNYGDGSGLQPLALNADHTFELTHVYGDVGTYQIQVNVRDGGGSVGTATLTATVNDASPDGSDDTGPQWQSPIPAESPSNALSAQQFILSTGYIVDPTVAFTLANPGNYSSTVPTDTTTTRHWTDANNIQYTAVETDNVTLSITATLTAGGAWTYDETFSDTYTVTDTGNGGAAFNESGSCGYTFDASGGPNYSAYTFSASGSGSASGTYTASLSDAAGDSGSGTYPWQWQDSYSRTISNTTNADGSATGSSSGSTTTSWSYSGSGTYDGASFTDTRSNTITTSDSAAYTLPASGGAWSVSGSATTSFTGSGQGALHTVSALPAPPALSGYGRSPTATAAIPAPRPATIPTTTSSRTTTVTSTARPSTRATTRPFPHTQSRSLSRTAPGARRHRPPPFPTVGRTTPTTARGPTSPPTPTIRTSAVETRAIRPTPAIATPPLTAPTIAPIAKAARIIPRINTRPPTPSAPTVPGWPPAGPAARRVTDGATNPTPARGPTATTSTTERSMETPRNRAPTTPATVTPPSPRS